MIKEKNNSNGLDNLDNYFMSITYMLKFLTYINRPSVTEIQNVLNDILSKMENAKKDGNLIIKKTKIEEKDIRKMEKVLPKIKNAIKFIAFNFKEHSDPDWEKKKEEKTFNEKFLEKAEEIFKDEIKGDCILNIDVYPLIEALFHVVDLMSGDASIIVLNKRIISSGYNTILPINPKLKEVLIDFENTNTELYVKKYTIIKSIVNAINNSSNVQSSTKGATIYTTSLPTIKDIYFAIQAEIKEIIYLEIDYSESGSDDFSYDKEGKEEIGMLLESGIKYKKILINTKTNNNDFLKSIIDFEYYYKNDKRQVLRAFVDFIRDSVVCKGRKIINENWVNIIFMAISYIVSFRSFDDGSKVGCSFVKEVKFGEFKQYILYSTGYNGFPNTLSHFHDKEKKEEYMVHAETNAILSIIKNNAKVHKDTIVYSNLYSCDECLKSLFNVKVKKIIYWEERYKKSRTINEENSFLTTNNMKIVSLTSIVSLASIENDINKKEKEINKIENDINEELIIIKKELEELTIIKKAIIKQEQFIKSFISFYKFNHFFNDNIFNDNISGLLKETLDEIIINYYSRFNLRRFLIADEHQTIFNMDEKLTGIEARFKKVVNLLQNDECPDCKKKEGKNYIECLECLECYNIKDQKSFWKTSITNEN